MMIVATLAAAGLARAARRRRWTLHALTAAACSLVLAAAAVYSVAGGAVDELPAWIVPAAAAVDILIIAVMVDLSRAKKHDQREAAR